MFSSIRHGLFAALAGFTVLICICYTGLALVIAYVTEDMVVERLLQREAAAIEAHFIRHGAPGRPASDWIQVYAEAAALPPAVIEQVRAGRARAEIFTDTGQHYHLRTLELGTGAAPRRLYLLADVSPLLVVSKLIQDVGGVVIFVALGLLGLALLLAWWLARRLVSPLLDLAQQVRHLGPEGGIAPAMRARPDEIGYLADKLGATLAELQAALAREHAFTRDVGHELRTPLTVMKNTLVRAASRPLDRQETVQLHEGIDEIGQTVEVLFALARAEHLAAEAFDLRASIEDRLLRLAHELAPIGERLLLDLPERLMVVGNRHLCTLLLDNCLANALFHGGVGARLRCSFANEVVAIENSCDPARPGAIHGFRHGRHLQQRMAAALEWELAFHEGPSGYRVEIAPLRAR